MSLISPDKVYRTSGYVNRSMNVVHELKEYLNKYNISSYYSKVDCDAYLNNVYPTLEFAFLDMMSSFGREVQRNVQIGEFTYAYVIPASKVAVVFAHNLTHSMIVDPVTLDTDDPKIGSYFFYHQHLTVNANRHGYECIHIFDWDDLCQISMIFLPKNLISCANCEVDIVSESELVLFLDLYHFRGSSDVAFDRGYAHLGLYYEDDLVCVLTVGQPKYQKGYDAEIYRMCIDPEYQISGGWRLLLNTYCNVFNPSSIVACRDMSKQFNSMYTELGMHLVGYTEPRTFWGRNHERLTEGPRFWKTLNIQYDENYSKSTQNLAAMLQHGWLPISDCGSAIYEWRST